jgi:3-oxoadipate enol-lactonase
MPRLDANGISINYDQQGDGEPLVLIPFLAADHACYAFQVADYAKHFTCISLDLRGTGESDHTDGAYTTEDLADDVAGLMAALGIERAHVAGLSLGAATGMWLAAKHPEKVKSLSLHSGWPKTDAFIATVIDSWRALASATGRVADAVVGGMFPWCLTPELYAASPDHIQSLADFVRSRPVQSVASYMAQTDCVKTHDVESQLGRIEAPTQVTFGRFDMVTSTRFADRMTSAIRDSELVIFEGCAHAPIFEKVEEFNQKTLSFLRRHT